MKYWLFKSEPSAYSWQQMEEDVTTEWDGVRNHQAQNFMKTMKIGDLGFFYHSIKDKAICGIVQLHKEHYYTTDPKFGMVDVKYYKPFKRQVTLKDMKENPALKSLVMLKQSRLSVSPVTEDEWHEIVRMSED